MVVAMTDSPTKSAAGRAKKGAPVLPAATAGDGKGDGDRDGGSDINGATSAETEKGNERKEEQGAAAEAQKSAEELHSRIAHLERENAGLQQECVSLGARIEDLHGKLLDQSEVNGELKQAKQALSDEIMELTKALFEEANGMVAAEAKARAHLEGTRRNLEAELKVTKEHLRLEKLQLFELRNRMHSLECSGKETTAVAYAAATTVSPPFSSPVHAVFDKSRYLAILQLKYFKDLLPSHRFDSRTKYDGPSSAIWDDIISKGLDRELFRSFAKFVEQCGELDDAAFLAHPLIRKIYDFEVTPCLTFEFKPKPFLARVVSAMLCNTCTIERIRTKSASTLPAPASHSRQSSLSGYSVADLQMDDPNALQLSSPVKSAASPPPAPHEPANRLRGIVSHFTASVSSLPETLLANMQSGSSTEASDPLAPPLSAGETAKYCCLCGRTSSLDATGHAPLAFRVRLSDLDPWMSIDGDCRQRLVAVGHYFTFLRHLRSGLFFNRPVIDLYYDLLHFRRNMFYTRLGTGATAFFLQSDFEQFLAQIESRILNEPEHAVPGARVEQPCVQDEAAHKTSQPGPAIEIVSPLEGGEADAPSQPGQCINSADPL